MNTVDLGNRIRDKFGRISLKPQGVVDAIYADKFDLDSLEVNGDPKIEEYNRWCRYFDRPEFQLKVQEDLPLSIDEWDEAHQNTWLIPEEWENLDIEEYLFALCTTEEEHSRVEEELRLFKERNMYPLLRCLTYMVEEMRANKIVWGVGRGSSVSSYVLFLIGVHKIDSLKWKLDVSEFLR